ncbi:MAG: c-type cytochrome [Acidobacteriaceae bacterium]|nr:c-type cytochrome [Acidobacteriaceae bacterium]
MTTAGPETSSPRTVVWVVMGIVCAATMWVTSCEPPGKPKAQEAQALNRESILDFKVLFESNCAGCHGSEGKNGPARILNDALYVAVIPKETLRNTVANGRPANGMPAWARSQGGPLTDKQIDALVNGIFDNWGKGGAKLKGATLPAYTAQSSGDANHGKQIFGKDCFMCHGPGAPIGPVTNASYLSLVTDQMLRTSVIVGRPDLGMPNYRFLNMGRALSDRDITDVVAYLGSQRPANVEGTTDNDVTDTGQTGEMTRGNEGSGHGPGSPRREEKEGNKDTGSSSQGGVR